MPIEYPAQRAPEIALSTMNRRREKPLDPASTLTATRPIGTNRAVRIVDAERSRR